MLDKSREIRLSIHEKRRKAGSLREEADLLEYTFIRQFAKEAEEAFSGQWVKSSDIDDGCPIIHHCLQVELAYVLPGRSTGDYNLRKDSVRWTCDAFGLFDEYTHSWIWKDYEQPKTCLCPVSELVIASVISSDAIVKDYGYTGKHK